MMDNNDNLQSRLDRIGQWKAFDIDWAHLRNLAVLGVVDLCALSVGIDPEYARLVRGMTTIDPDNIPKPEEIAELLVFLLGFTNHMNLIAMTGIQGIKYHLIDIGKRQLDTRVCQQFTDKATTDITCAKM